MTPEHHRLDVVGLVDLVLVLEDAVNPAGHRNALGMHHLLGLEPALEIVVGDIPDTRPVRPRALLQAVVAGQRMRKHAEVGRTLHVVVTAEDVAAATGGAHVAQRKLQNAVSAGVIVAVGVLRAAHAPDHGAGLVVGHRTSHATKLRRRNAGDLLGLFRIPLLHFLTDLVHAPDALANELLVLPAILENVPEDAPDQRHVCARTEPDIFGGVCGGTGEARIENDQLGVVLLLRLHQVKQGHRVRFGRVAADQEDRAGIVDVVIGVRHRAVAPGVGNTRDRGRVTDTGLVVTVVGAPERVELPEQVGLLVIVLRGSEPVHRVGARGLADLEHLVADLVDGVFPLHPLPFAADQLGRIFQPAFAMRVLTHRRTLGAMGAEVERAVESGLLAEPDTAAHLSEHGATDRTVGAHGFLDFNRAVRSLGFSLLDHAATDRGSSSQSADRKTRTSAGMFACQWLRLTTPLGPMTNGGLSPPRRSSS